MKPPVSPRKVERQAEESGLLRYGIAFRAWDLVRTSPIPVGLGPNVCHKVFAYRIALYKFRSGLVWFDEDGVLLLAHSITSCVTLTRSCNTYSNIITKQRPQEEGRSESL